VTEAHITIVLAQDQVTRADPKRAHDVHELLVDAIVSRDLERVHQALIVHTVDSAKGLIDILRSREPACPVAGATVIGRSPRR
jgi:DNA-binding GntR family transcriptional regulator